MQGTCNQHAPSLYNDCNVCPASVPFPAQTQNEQLTDGLIQRSEGLLAVPLVATKQVPALLVDSIELLLENDLQVHPAIPNPGVSFKMLTSNLHSASRTSVQV